MLTAPPGSGKTTVVPLTLLEQAWLGHKKILILEPRRLAARAAAARMASLLGEPIGQTVGYQIRCDRRIGPATRIEVLTEGILTRRLQTDSNLGDVGLIVFDEFHERSLQADLALALCLDLCQLKEDLRLLVMSATLDGAANVAANLKAVGAEPVVVGTLQDDLAGERLLRLLVGLDIHSEGVVLDSSRPTIIKTRVIGLQQQMLRIDRSGLEAARQPLGKLPGTLCAGCQIRFHQSALTFQSRLVFRG